MILTLTLYSLSTNICCEITYIFLHPRHQKSWTSHSLQSSARLLLQRQNTGMVLHDQTLQNSHLLELQSHIYCPTGLQ